MTTIDRPGQRAEWHRAKVVLVCRPAIETLFAVLNTDAANFLQPFDPDEARAEHDAMRASLEAHGARVVDVREALAGGDPTMLREAASRALVYYAQPGVGDVHRAEGVSV